ncbi:hypothetical protein BH10BAC3_BH10BAC3_38570 [soil metagenome]
MFLHAQWHKLITQYLPKKDARTLDYYFPFPFEKYDTTIYELPTGFTDENIPESFDLVYKYGEYHSG